MEFERKIINHGNSSAALIPKDMMTSQGISVGDTIIWIVNDEIKVEFKKKEAKTNDRKRVGKK